MQGFIKKIVSVFLIPVAFLLACSPCVFAQDAPIMDFQPDKGGKFIYCNNPEWIRRENLADNSNQFAKFIMNNEGLTAEKYAMFISLVNRTDLTKPEGGFLEAGFDIEVDVLFRAKEDTEVKFTSVGFEVPEQTKYYLDGNAYTGEEDLGCFTAWASYMKMPISQLDSGKKYTPVPFEEQIVTVKAGEDFWMSEIIPNYREVPFCRVIHMMSDFEVLSGVVDVNVAALRSTGTLRDRSDLAKNVRFGSYIRENQHKGIADSLNKTDVNLSFTIDDSYVSGTKLPVTIVNQYAYLGNTVTNWFTNLNPRADIWNKYSAVESSLLKFTYKDPSKLKYYGSNVAEKDDIWHFDAEHSDTSTYPGIISGVQKRNYAPNFFLQGLVDESLCPSLGNYGVFQNYHVTINSNAKEDKYLLYKLYTVSNNLIILRDENGEILSPYPITKGATPTKESDCLACVKLPAGKETAFTLTVVLTTNHFGGMENAFVVSDMPMPVRSYPSSCYYNVKDKDFTGKEMLKWQNGDLWKSESGEVYEPVGISAELEKKFHGRTGELQFLHTPKGYMVRSCLYDGTPYYNVRKFYRDVYLLDENFALKDSYSFEMYPTDMSYANGMFYMKAGTVYESSDFKSWVPSALAELPVGNNGNISAFMRNGSLYIRAGETDYTRLTQTMIPPYIDSVGNVFYYVDESGVHVSKNLMNWKTYETMEPVTSVAIGNNILKINNKDGWIPFELPEGTLIRKDNQILGMEKNIYAVDNTLFVPLRAFGETIGAEVTWQAETGAAFTFNGKTHYFKEHNMNGTICITEEQMETILDQEVSLYPDAIVIG